MKGFYIIGLLMILLLSCEDEPTQYEKDQKIIKDYISEQNLDMTKHSSGLYYKITKQGQGTTYPGSSSTVKVRYKGYLTDGTVFDETSGDETREFLLSGLILGWQYGLPLLTRDAEALFILPSALGYGAYPQASIPANSVLIFEIELVDFVSTY